MLHYLFSNFLQHLFLIICISSQLNLFIKGLNFAILSGFLPVSSWFNTTVTEMTVYWKHLLSFLLMKLLLFFCFLSNHGNLYMIHHDLDLSDTIMKIIKDKLPTKYSSWWSRLEDVCHFRLCLLQKTSRCLQDMLKTYYQVKLFLLTRLRDIFNTFLRRTTKTTIYRRFIYCDYLGHTSEKFMVSSQNLQKR